MGDKEFHQMLGKLIDTEGTRETQKLIDLVEAQQAQTQGAQTPEERIKELANKEGIQLDQKDITDLVNCIKELHKIKGGDFARSPRN